MADVDDTDTATERVLSAMFEGAPAGQEAASRAPVRVRGRGLASSFIADHRMANGWTYDDGEVRQDIGSHDELRAFLRSLIAGNADHAWAKGVRPIRPTPFANEFAFSCFAADPDPKERCRRLADSIDRRIQDSPCPPLAVAAAIEGLRSLGHDLWSWTPGEVWGRDYVTRRKGAGLTVTLYEEAEHDEDDPEATGVPHVVIEFQQPDEAEKSDQP